MKSLNSTLIPNDGYATWVPLLELATIEVFELMLGCSLTKPGTDTVDQFEGPQVTSLVGLAGQLCGVLSIRSDEASAARMASRMLGGGSENAHPQMADAIGEICNMVAGNFKNKIPGLGDGCMLSTPTVITGESYDLHSPAYSPGLEIRLLFENQLIIISLQIHS